MLKKILKIVLYSWWIFILLLIIYLCYNYRVFEKKIEYRDSQEYKEQVEEDLKYLESIDSDIKRKIINLDSNHNIALVHNDFSFYFSDDWTYILDRMSKSETYDEKKNPDFMIQNNNAKDFIMSYKAESLISEFVLDEQNYLWRLVFYSPSSNFYHSSWSCGWYVFKNKYRRPRWIITDGYYYNIYTREQPYLSCWYPKLWQSDVRSFPDVTVTDKFKSQ